MSPWISFHSSEGGVDTLPFLQLHYNVPWSDSRGNANLEHMHSEDVLEIRWMRWAPWRVESFKFSGQGDKEMVIPPPLSVPHSFRQISKMRSWYRQRQRILWLGDQVEMAPIDNLDFVWRVLWELTWTRGMRQMSGVILISDLRSLISR